MSATFDEICELREEWEASLPHDEYRRRVIAKVDELKAGDPGRAELLECLASDVGDEVSERSLEFARAAVDDGGPTTLDARVAVVRALYGLGRDDEATALVRELIRAPARDNVTVGLHAALGEVLEMADRPREAHRAYTVGLKELEPDHDDPTMDEDMCLAGRYRVRRRLGLGADAFDRCLEELTPGAAAAIRERAAAGLTY